MIPLAAFALSGCLALTPAAIDIDSGVANIETLKLDDPSFSKRNSLARKSSRTRFMFFSKRSGRALLESFCARKSSTCRQRCR